MPLIPYADTSALPEKAKEAFDRLPRKLNIFRMWANAPEMFTSGLRFGGNILGRQKLRADLRELIILLVARLERGEYEWVQHVPIAEHAGCRKDQIAALEAARITGGEFSPKEAAMLKLSQEVIRDVRASEATVAEAKKHFSPQEIVEIIITCGFYMTMARLTETTRVDIDAPGGAAVLDGITKQS
ncbi:MAG TPA: carboxymuconolactone decarboxylase family protein [Rhizomicrobium sp.]|jgi:alkylhydroperoxidase family enzyme